MTKEKKNDKSGFTIIEVLIVLAIAALIILIVFLSYPALTRSVRNHQRKVDAGTTAAAVLQYTADYGVAPNLMRTDVNADGTTNDDTYDLSYRPTKDDPPGEYSTVRMQYYNVGDDPYWGHDAGPDVGNYRNYGANISRIPVKTLVTPDVIPIDDNDGISAYSINTESFTVIAGENCNAAGNGAGQLVKDGFAVFYVLEIPGGDGILRCVD